MYLSGGAGRRATAATARGGGLFGVDDMALEPQSVEQHARHDRDAGGDHGVEQGHFPAKGGPHQADDDGVQQWGDKQEGESGAKASLGREQPSQHGDGGAAAKGGDGTEQGREQIALAMSRPQHPLDLLVGDLLTDQADPGANDQKQHRQLDSQKQEHLGCIGQHG